MAGPYYVDFNAGSNGNTGLSIGQSWADIHYALQSAQGVAAGETIFVRANTTWIPAADIAPTVDGSVAAFIKIIGADSVTNDPWSDSSDVLPLIDFNAAAVQLKLENDDYIWFERLRFLNSHDSIGNVQLITSKNIVFKTCTFEDASRRGLFVNVSAVGIAIDCTFVNNGDGGGEDLNCSRGRIHLQNCTFDPFSTNRNCMNNTGGYITATGCTFSNALVGVFQEVGGVTLLRNCVFSSVTTHVDIVAGPATDGVYVGEPPSVMSDGTDIDTGLISKGAQFSVQFGGTYDSSATYARPGGATQGLRVQTNTNCDLNTPIRFMQYFINQDAASHTYRFYVNFPDSNFGSDLDQTELWFRITELEDDGTVTQSTIPAKTWDYDAGDGVWQTMDVTFDADTSGVLRVEGFIARSDANGIIEVDPQVDIDP